MTGYPQIVSPLYPVIPSTGGADTGTGVNTSNLVRYAVGQPQFNDPGGQVSAWSYDENTGTLSVTYANNLAAPLTPQTAPHWSWTMIGFDGVSTSTANASGDHHWWSIPIATDITYSGPNSDDPSVAVGFTNANVPQSGQGVSAVWTKIGANAGISCATYTPPTGYSSTPLDSAPTTSAIGSLLVFSPRSIFGANGTDMETPRACSISSTGDYDTGQEANFNGVYTYFRSVNYLDVWIGCAQYSGGAGSVTAGSTITCTVATMAIPLFPRFLGSNFIKQP